SDYEDSFYCVAYMPSDVGWRHKYHSRCRRELRQKFCYPGSGGKWGGKDTLRQKWVLPWAEWIKQ
ncbi:MAG TPA: hypothetical protein VFC44_24990, partial [Candidatus Saccharimonadales bacterium]|nr:hypothetical protein [Candidatus Saccharimonadales bacterium]